MTPGKVALAIADEVAKLLRGWGPEIQGAILAELTSRWLVGHPNFVRGDLLAMHIESINQLVPTSEEVLFDGKGHPQNVAPS
jgi:hypothetical protein